MPNPQLTVEIGAKITDLERNLAKAQKSLQKFSDKTVALGKKFKSIGTKMSVGLTLPLALFGGIAVKSFAKFESELAKIEGLVGIAGDEVAAMGKKAKSMASDFGKSGIEAAEALFFITSAGLRGKEAMDVLRQSMKASVAGLGEAKVIADLATSAMNAYGSEVLSASGATDILTKSVREGKLEASSLGAAMGAVLPIASAMGVTFNEVGATFAAMSRTGTKAAVAATQLKAILFGILRPTAEAEKALAAMGLSSAMLRQNIKDKGLLDTLEILSDKFKGNDEAAGLVFGSIEALSGVMDLMGKNVAGTREIFESLNNSMGATDEAFKAVANTAAFKFNVAVKGVTNELDTFGGVITDMLLPKLEKLTDWLKRVLERFNNLSDGWKKFIVKIILVVAALGPLLVALGFLMTTIIPGLITVFAFLSATVLPAVIGAFHKLTAAMLANPIGLVIAAIAALTFWFVSFVQKLNPAISKLETFWNLLRSGGTRAGFLVLQMESLAKATVKEFEATKKANEELAKFKKEQEDGVKAAAKLTAELLKQVTAVKSVTKALRPKKTTDIKAPRTSLIEDPTGESKIVNLPAIVVDIKKKLDSSIVALNEFNQEANFIIQTGIVDTFAGIGAAIGDALINGKNVLQAAGSALLAGIGEIATRLGKAAIRIGTTMLAIKLAFKNPLTAIAAGIALVALGSALGAIANNAINGGSGESFAGDTGGGGSRRGTRSSISNITPGSSGGTVVWTIEGTKLVGVLQNTLRRNSALGGNINLLGG